MASKTDICNEALTKVGEPRIASIEDTSDINAVFLSTTWDTTVRQVMREIPWRCFTKRATLTASSTAPAFDWAHAFPLPVDCLRVLWVNGHSDPDPPYYSVDSDSILTNATTVELVYTAFSDDTTTYDPAFIEAFSTYLASKLAFTRRQEYTMSQVLTEAYRGQIQARSQVQSLVESKSMWTEYGTANPVIADVLLRIAEPKVTDFNDASFPSHTAIDELFERAVRIVGRVANWQGLAVRASITAEEDAPAFEWSYAYALPDDCLRITTMNGQPVNSTASFFKQEGNLILTNAETCDLVYVGFTLDTTKFDPLFTEAVTLYIASQLALLRRRADALVQRFQLDYEKAVSRARMIDANQRNQLVPDLRYRSPMEASRRNWASGPNPQDTFP